MLHPNHWFTANDQGSELRISRWGARTRLRPGTRHLCGQTCLHKLVDEFTAQAVSQRVSSSAGKPTLEDQYLAAALHRTEKGLASPRVFPVPALPTVSAAFIPATQVENKDAFESSARLLTPSEPSSRRSPVDAWKRERERQQQSADPRTIRRRSIA